MVKGENKPFGYIYKATNTVNGKVYIGKTTKTIEKRWEGHKKKAEALKRAREAFPTEKLSGTHFNNAINKYGCSAFSLNQEDTADSKAELKEKEKHYVKEYDSMNREKGYNMTEGGEGGKLRPEVIEKLRKISLELAKDPEWHEKVSKGVSSKYQNDPVYSERQTQERRERTKDPEWIEKMTKINQEKAKDPEYIEKISKINQEKGKDPKFQEKVSKAITNKWDNDPEYRKKQEDERKERAKDPNFINKMREIGKPHRKEISDKRQFLNDIKNNMYKKDMLENYNMGKNSFNKRIQEMFGPNGPKNYTELKNYLQDKDLNEVLKEIKGREAEREDEKRETIDNSEKSDNKPSEEKPEEENPSSGAMDKNTLNVKESTEERNNELIEEEREKKADEPKEKSIEEENDRIEEDLSGEQVAEPKEPPGVAQTDESERQPETEFKESSNKFSSKAFKKLGVERFPDDIKVTSPDGKGLISIKDLKQYSDRNKLTVKWTSGREYNEIPNKLPKDYDGIEQSKIDKGDDFQGIDKDISKSDKDYNRIDDAPVEEGNEFDGIDNPQEKGDKDFNDIDDDYPERGVESGEGP